MQRVVHFEIHAADPESIIPFYQQLFGWQFDAWGPPGTYWLIRTAPGQDASAAGIDGGLVQRRGPAAAEGQPVNAFVCSINVESASASLARAVELGGTIAVPIMPIPMVGWLAYAKDPNGNIFGMMQNDPAAQ